MKRLLHTMIRVGDLEKSISFYTRIMGMRLLRRQDYPGGRFTLAFVGYGQCIWSYCDWFGRYLCTLRADTR